MGKINQQIITSFNLTKSVNSLVALPQSINELQECLERSKKEKLKISIKGAGNSYSDIFQNSDQLLIDTYHLNLIKHFDSKNGFVVVEPGVRIGELLSLTMPCNWGLVGLSGSVTDLIGGMVSSNTHGKDTWKNGNFSQNISSLKVLLVNGEIEEVSRQKNIELFNGIVGGLGFLGVIVEITLKLKPLKSIMVQVSKKRIHDFDQLFDFFYSLEKTDCEFAYALIDAFSPLKSIGRGTCVSSKYINIENCSNSDFKEFLSPKKKICHLKPETFWSLVRPFWGDTLCSLLNKARFFLYSDDFSNSCIQPYSKFQYVYSVLPKFNLIYAPSGFWEFQVIFPKEKAIPAFIELMSISKKFKCRPWICMIKRHKPDEPFLSFSGDGLSIAMNFSLKYINSVNLEKYCKTLFELILKYNGTSYLSKHAIFPKLIFQEMYPQYKNIINLKNKYDPNLVFSSDATRRLFIDN
jgi:decaprenylphospho-beta-D-ribofuranose 2-oxidase